MKTTKGLEGFYSILKNPQPRVAGTGSCPRFVLEERIIENCTNSAALINYGNSIVNEKLESKGKSPSSEACLQKNGDWRYLMCVPRHPWRDTRNFVRPRPGHLTSMDGGNVRTFSFIRLAHRHLLLSGTYLSPLSGVTVHSTYRGLVSAD